MGARVQWKVGDQLVHQNLGLGVVTHVFGEGKRQALAVTFASNIPKVLDPRVAPIFPAASQKPAELDNEDPVRRPDGNFRWKGALFSTREEMLLAKALMDQGAMGVASNSSLVLQRSSKLHRKPDLLVFHNVEDRLVFGIAEVDGSSHEGRWANDQERHRELQAAGFLCIRHYTAEEVFLDPVRAARDFLSFLEKFHPTGQRTSLLRM
jgi:hypothetical protein